MIVAIATFYKGYSRIGFRLLDCETEQIKDVREGSVVESIMNNICEIYNLDIINGQLTGLGCDIGDLSTIQYNDQENYSLKKSNFYIIGEREDRGEYKLVDWQGKVYNIPTSNILSKSSKIKNIANAKIIKNSVKPLDGRDFIKYKVADMSSRSEREYYNETKVYEPKIIKEEKLTTREREKLQDRLKNCLDGLNERQLLAATTLQGNIRLIAGAGTGKTNTLTKRIGNLILNGAEPNRILSVTFTNKAAAEMRQRTANLLDISEKFLSMQTFHSLCAKILRENIDCLGWSKSFTLGGNSGLREMLRDIMTTDNDYTKIVPTDRTYIIKKFMELSKEMRSEGDCDYVKYLVDGNLPPKKSLRELIKYEQQRDLDVAEKRWDYSKDKESPTKCYIYHLFAYQRRIKYLSFDDLIAMTVYMFQENKEVLEYWQGKFDYIQVDEFQDTNPLQFKLIDMLGKKCGNIFVVGDPDQSIYKFRDACPEILIDLDKKLPNVRTIIMDLNYRSYSPILDVGNSVIKLCSNRIEKDLKPLPKNMQGNLPRVLYGTSDYTIADEIVQEIDNKIKEGIKPSEIAVLYRSKMASMLKMVADRLIIKKIPFKIYGAGDMQRSPEFDFTINLFSSIVNTSNHMTVLEMLKVIRGYRKNKKITNYIKDECDNGGSSIEALKRLVVSRSFKIESYNSLDNICDFIDQAILVDKDPKLKISSLTSELNDLLLNVFSEESKEMVDLICERLTEFGRIAELENLDNNCTDFLTKLTLDEDQEDEENDADEDKVQIMTIHKSKGLEFDCVFVLNVNTGVFPNGKATGDYLDEEVRLAYVAYTRAKKELFIATFSGRMFSGFNTEPSILVCCLPTDKLKLNSSARTNWIRLKRNAEYYYERARE